MSDNISIMFSAQIKRYPFNLLFFVVNYVLVFIELLFFSRYVVHLSFLKANAIIGYLSRRQLIMRQRYEKKGLESSCLPKPFSL